MEACRAVERETDRVSSNLGRVQADTTAAIYEVRESLMQVQNRWRKASIVEKQVNLNDPKFQGDLKVIRDVSKRLPELLKKVSTSHRQQHTVVSKVGKFIDQKFNREIGLMTTGDGLEARNRRRRILNHAILEHLERNGFLGIADGFFQEVGDRWYSCVDSPNDNIGLITFNDTLKALKQRQLSEVFKWVDKNREANQISGLKGKLSTLEFKLHRMAFIQILEQQNPDRTHAINYARANFSPFVKEFEKEIQTLMGALVCDRNSLRYKHLYDKSQWADLEELFISVAVARLGLAVNSSLETSAAAGCNALPTLLSNAQLLQDFSNQEIDAPLLDCEVDLDKKFKYHSVFTCPILRYPTTASNHPVRLSCGHCISILAVHNLVAISRNNKFRCPYCPGEKNPNEAKKIVF